jgi:hypothetical protein
VTALSEAQAARAELHRSTYWPAALKQKGANHLWQTDVHLAATIAALTPKRHVGISPGAGPGTPTSLSGLALEGYYDSLRAVGADAVRLDCRGLTQDFDFAVRRALDAELNVLIVFPDDVTLAGPCAAKYVPLGVTDYETGNEPNIRGVSSADFLASHTAAYMAIKKVSNATKVISAGLAPFGSYGNVTATQVNPVSYLESILKLGKLLYDALGWHPYSFYKGATGVDMLAYHDWSAYTQMGAIGAGTPSALALIRAHGLPEKIAVTEIGAPTYSEGVTERAQADFIHGAILDLQSRPYIDDIYIYSLRDRPELGASEAHFGIEGKLAANAIP